MIKRIWFIIGLLTGILITELFRRHRIEQLEKDAAKAQVYDDFYAQAEQDFHAYYDTLSTEEKISHTLRMIELEKEYSDNIDND